MGDWGKVTSVTVLFDDGTEVTYAGDAWYRERSNTDANPLRGRGKRGWTEHEVVWTTDHHPVGVDAKATS